jgi:glycerol kinase
MPASQSEGAPIPQKLTWPEDLQIHEEGALEEEERSRIWRRRTGLQLYPLFIVESECDKM